MIGFSTGKVPVTPVTGNDILPDSNGKIQMRYVVSDPEPDVWYET